MAILSRRQALAAATLPFALCPLPSALLAAQRVVRNGRLRQSVTRWTYRSIALPDLCRAAADIGLGAIDLLEEPDWAAVRPFGLVCSMGYAGGGSIADGLNVKANHDAIVSNFTRLIPRAEAGDVIRTIRANRDIIGHFHTGGVPGRHELDDTQEINWRAVCRAIADSGFTGYLAHEFTPTRDPLTSLREAVAVCDV